MSIFENEKFIVANFKQSGNMNSMKEWLVEFKKQLNELGELKINIVLCPSFQFLDLFNRELGLENKNPKIFIGSQNLSSFSNLENTGEVGAENLKDLVKFSLLGHSERKENFDDVTRKYQNAITNTIVPIVCFYDNKEVYSLDNCLFAYEDPNAISKDGVYKDKDFNDMVGVIQSLKELFEDKPVLYGGSVRPENAQMIKDLNFFKGVLVGRASLDAKSLAEIIKVFNK